MSDFGHATKPVARKRHQCIHCLQFIVVGERHERFVGKWQGDFQDWRNHLDCGPALRRCQDDDGTICVEGHARGRPCPQREG